MKIMKKIHINGSISLGFPETKNEYLSLYLDVNRVRERGKRDRDRQTERKREKETFCDSVFTLETHTRIHTHYTILRDKEDSNLVRNTKGLFIIIE